MADDREVLAQLKEERNRLFERYDELNDQDLQRYADLNKRVKDLESTVAKMGKAASAQVTEREDPKNSSRVNVFVMCPGKRNNDLSCVAGTSIYDALRTIGFDMNKTWVVQKRVGQGASVEIRDLRGTALTDENTELFVTEKVGGAA